MADVGGAGGAGAGTGAAGVRLPDGLPPLQPGTVWLVGAGPGDPGLLSLLAAHALRSADAVLHDAAVGEAILGLAHAGTGSVEPVPASAAAAAAAANRCVRLAREGWRVVRLVDGDPLSRPGGVDAALRFAEAGVLFRVVPAVTASVAGLSYAGVPITHREFNSAVSFLDLTGLDLIGAAERGEIARLAGGATAAPVLVASLRRGQLRAFAELLLAGGLAPSTNLLLVADPTGAAQENIETTLASCAGEAGGTDGTGDDRPLVLMLGRNVELAHRLAWRDRDPPALAAPIAVATMAGLAG